MSIQEIKQFQRELRKKQRKLNRDVNQAARRGGQVYTQTAKRHIIENDSVASTELFRGVGYQRLSKPNGTAVRLNSSAGHSGYVEHGVGQKGDGTFPDNPNVGISTIKQWMEIKPGFRLPDTWAVAGSIARKIRGNTDEPGGITQQPFFEPAKDAAWNTVILELRESLEDNFGEF